MCFSLFIMNLSKKGIVNKGIIPPKTIPSAAERIVGSKAAAIKSAKIWAITAPIIPAICPLEANFKSLLILHPL